MQSRTRGSCAGPGRRSQHAGRHAPDRARESPVRRAAAAAIPLHAAAPLHERSQRAGVLQGRVPPLLPAQPLRCHVGPHELGPRGQPRPARLAAPAGRAARGGRDHDLLGHVVVDWKNTSGFCRASGEDASCLVAIYTGHRPDRQTQNLAYSNDRGRTWTKYAQPCRRLGHEGFPRSEGVLARRHQAMGDGHRAARSAQGAVLRLARSQEVGALSDFGPAGPRAACGSARLFPLPVDGVTTDVGWVLDVDLNPGASPAARADSTSWAVSTARASSTTTRPTARCGGLRQGLLRHDLVLRHPPADGRRIWMGWISNWLYANEEPTEVWRGAQSVPRVLGLRRTPTASASCSRRWPNSTRCASRCGGLDRR